VQRTLDEVKYLCMQGENEDVCIICRSDKSEYIFIPCGHKCVCSKCAQELIDCCPYCRTEHTSITKVYTV
jgi:hypothetical protein